MKQKNATGVTVARKQPFGMRLRKDIYRNKYVYLMLLPVVAWYILFCYMPMYGASIAFKDYNVFKGIMGSEWVGWQHFVRFFNDPIFYRVLKNTLVLSVLNIICSFPAPIILALLLNEITNNKFKRTVQTVTYLPHFISVIVVCGMITQFCARDGMITRLLMAFGVENQNLLAVPEYFRAIYIGSGIWQELGWGTIVYLSAIAGIDPGLYEAATVDGAGRFRQTISITIPSIIPTVVVLLIMKVGQTMNLGYEKVLLLYNPVTREKADIISTYVYRLSFEGNNEYSYSAAIGLFNALINMVLLIGSNRISNKLTGSGLW